MCNCPNFSSSLFDCLYFCFSSATAADDTPAAAPAMAPATAPAAAPASVPVVAAASAAVHASPSSATLFWLFFLRL